MPEATNNPDPSKKAGNKSESENLGKKKIKDRKQIRATVLSEKKEEIEKFCKKYKIKMSSLIQMAVDMIMNNITAKIKPQIILLSPESELKINQLVARSIYQGNKEKAENTG